MKGKRKSNRNHNQKQKEKKNMEHMLSLFVRSIFVDNMIFAFFLGMCSYLAVSKNVKTALGLGVAVTFVLCVTVPVDYLLQTKVLAEDGVLGMDLTYFGVYPFHSRDCRYRAVGRDGGGTFFSFSFMPRWVYSSL